MRLIEVPYNLSGLWSRRLSHEHRLVCKINPDGVVWRIRILSSHS
ncbi:MAG: type II toxin-antitoxin system YoeB family toxin [Holosporales bacterium]